MPNGLPLLSLFIYMPSTSASDATGLCTDGYVRALFFRGFVDAHCFNVPRVVSARTASDVPLRGPTLVAVHVCALRASIASDATASTLLCKLLLAQCGCFHSPATLPNNKPMHPNHDGSHPPNEQSFAVVG